LWVASIHSIYQWQDLFIKELRGWCSATTTDVDTSLISTIQDKLLRMPPATVYNTSIVSVHQQTHAYTAQDNMLPLKRRVAASFLVRAFTCTCSVNAQHGRQVHVHSADPGTPSKGSPSRVSSCDHAQTFRARYFACKKKIVTPLPYVPTFRRSAPFTNHELWLN
jgi:hypothetical protein